MQKALATLPWVRHVQVNFDKKQAVVTAEADGYDEEALLKVLGKEGFGGKAVK